MFPFRTGIGTGAAGEITFVSAVASTLSTITVPAARLTNDLILLMDVAVSDTVTPPASVTPTGFTAIGSSTTGTVSGLGVRYNASYKVSVGSEGLTTGMNGLQLNNKMMFLIRPPGGGTWGTPGSINAVVQSTPPSNQTVTVTAAPLVVVGVALDAFSGLTLSMSPAAFANQDNGQGLQTGYIIYSAGSAVNNTVSTNMTGGGALGSFYFPLSA